MELHSGNHNSYYYLCIINRALFAGRIYIEECARAYMTKLSIYLSPDTLRPFSREGKGKVYTLEPAGKKKDRSCVGDERGNESKASQMQGEKEREGEERSKSKGHTRSVHCKIGACGTRNLRYRRMPCSRRTPLPPLSLPLLVPSRVTVL